MNDEGDKKADKRKQHCTACRNHDRKQRKTSHKCPFEGCDCLLCQLTQTSRLIMRHQQRLWRHLKDKNTGNEQQRSKKQVCDKCRNHGIMISKRNHKGSCPFESCKCELCGLTSNRRDIMRHQQRVRRSATVTSHEQKDAYEYVQKTKMEIHKKFGDVGLGNAEADGYSSTEEKDDTPSSPEESLSSGQEGTKKQFIERYRRNEIITRIPWEDEDKKPYQLSSQRSQQQQELSSPPPQPPSNSWHDNTNILPEASTSKTSLSQYVKEERIYAVAERGVHNPIPCTLITPVPKRTKYSLPSYQLPRYHIPNGLPNGLMCSMIRPPSPTTSSYPLNLFSGRNQTRPFTINYLPPFNKSQHPMIPPPFPPH